VRRFQKRQGLEPDGVVGARSLKALNRSVDERIAQVTANMERWRWLPRDLGERYLLVNTASFELIFVERARIRLSMAVAVGREKRRTPLFSSELRGIVLNPDWTVPPTILREDYIPKLRRDRGWLAAEGFELRAGWTPDAPVMDPEAVDWAHVSARDFPYRIVQRPGPLNALGKVKFVLPNRHDVYLHDTPHHEIFTSAERAFSSGCVRLAAPELLVGELLTELPGWDMARVQEIWARGKTTYLPLKRRLPVHFVYFTAIGQEGGGVDFRSDLYGRDAAFDAAVKAVSGELG
jgi:murein L,D-transpeptidase YcbB/YkuD